MALEGMRDLLRRSLGRSLETMREEDRLAVAWPVACGKTMANHGTIAGFSAGILLIEIAEGPWARQMISMQSQLAAEVGRISGVPVRSIQFAVKGKAWKKHE